MTDNVSSPWPTCPITGRVEARGGCSIAFDPRAVLKIEREGDMLVATLSGMSIATQGRDMRELGGNLREALELALDVVTEDLHRSGAVSRGDVQRFQEGFDSREIIGSCGCCS